MNNVERTWRGLPLEFDGAAQSTVEAVMYSLRERGAASLREDAVLDRLSQLSPEQFREVIGRLTKLKPRYPAITDDLLATLEEFSKCR